MKKVPAIIYAGAGILAYMAAKLMVMDQGVGPYIASYGFYLEVLFTVGVLSIGFYKNHYQQVH